MKTRSLFPGEVSVYIIPHQAAAGVEILVVFSTRGSSNFQALHEGWVCPSHRHLQTVFSATWRDGEENTNFNGVINPSPGIVLPGKIIQSKNGLAWKGP